MRKYHAGVFVFIVVVLISTAIIDNISSEKTRDRKTEVGGIIEIFQRF